MAGAKKKRINMSDAWREAKSLVFAHRGRLAFGAVLMLINRLVGLVLPASSKYIIDDVIGKNKFEMLTPIAIAAGAATLMQAVTSFSLSQVLGVAAQRAITEMRKRVQEQVARLPISYFDSTQTGKLISRMMNDAEGIRNLVGTGLVQLVGSSITAVIALGVLIYLNWRLTAMTIVVLAAFGGGLAFAFKRLRPMFRERGEIYSQSHGTSGRIARWHSHRQSLHRRKARRTGLRARRAPALSQCRKINDRSLGDHGLLFGHHRRDWSGDDHRRRSCRS